jgi:hypothetical protein
MHISVRNNDYAKYNTLRYLDMFEHVKSECLSTNNYPSWPCVPYQMPRRLKTQSFLLVQPVNTRTTGAVILTASRLYVIIAARLRMLGP